MTTNTNRAAASINLIGIVRVSTEGQAGVDGEGLARQEEAIRGVAAALGVEVDRLTVELFTDVGGGSLAETAGWRERVRPLLDDPRFHIATDDVDRLCRLANLETDMEVLKQLQSTGTRIYYPGGVRDLGNPDDLFQVLVLAAMGGNEKARLKRRVFDGKESKRRKGEFPTSTICLSVGIDFNHKRRIWSYTPDIWKPKTAFRLLVDEGLRNLTEIGRRCGGHSNQTVRNWLANPVYRGVFVWDTKRGKEAYAPRVSGGQPDRRKVPRAPEKVIEARVFPPDRQAVTDEVWEQAQHILARFTSARRKRKSETAPLIPFSGFLFSAYEPLGPRPAGGFVDLDDRAEQHVLYGRSGGRTRPARYICRCKATLSTDPNRPEPACQLRHLLAAQVNQALDMLFEGIAGEQWFRDAVLADIHRTKGDAEAEIQITTRSLSKLLDREGRLLELYEVRAVDLTLYDRRRREIRKEMGLLDARLRRLREGRKPDETKVRGFLAELKYDAAWHHTQKRAWLSRYVRGIAISNGGVEWLTVRLPANDESLASFVLIKPFAWASLLGHDPFDLAERMAAGGKFLTSQAAGRLGLTVDALRRYVRIGVLAEPGGRHGDKRVWTDDELDDAQAALRHHRGEDKPKRWGLPVAHEYSRYDLAKIVGLSPDRIRYLIKKGDIADPPRDARGRRVWTPEQVEELVGRLGCLEG